MNLESNAASAYSTLCEASSLKPNATLMKMLAATSLRELRVLDVSKAYVGPKHCLLLAQLAEDCTALEAVNFSGNSVSSEVISTLAASLSRSAVAKVDLSHNSLDINSGRVLLDLIKHNAAIVSLNLDGTMLPDYILEDAKVQLDLNTLTFRKREADAKNKASDVACNINLAPRCLEDLDFDDVSNIDDIEGACDVDHNYFDEIVEVNADVATRHDSEQNSSESSPNGSLTLPSNSFLLQGDAMANFQSVEEIQHAISTSMIDGTMHRDGRFPVFEASVPLPLNSCVSGKAGVVWIRFRDWCSAKGLSPSCSGHSPLVDGRVHGLHWLGCAINVIREHDVLRKGMCVRSIPNLGIFVFVFHKGTSKLEVLVDDFVPVLLDGNGVPSEIVTVHHEDPSDCWATLLEKAYAKLHGGYDRLMMGSMRYALADMTGGVCLKQKWSISQLRYHRELVYERLRGLVIHKRIVAVKSSATGELQRKSHIATGILPNRSYVLKNVVPLSDGLSFAVQLTSPSVAVLWQGRLSRGSPEAAQFRQDVAYDENLSNRDVWMLLEDFLAFFENIYVLMHVPAMEPSLMSMMYSKLRTFDISAPYGSAMWPRNPCFLLQTSEKQARVIVRVSQADQRLRLRSGLSYGCGIQVHVHRLSSESKQYVFEPDDLIRQASNDFVFGRDVLIDLTLYRGMPVQLTISSSADRQPVEIVATSKDVFTMTQFARDTNVAVAVGAWEGSLAAGRHHHSTGIEHGMQFAVEALLAQPIIINKATLSTQPRKPLDNAEVVIFLEQLQTTHTIGIVGSWGTDRFAHVGQLVDKLEVPFANATLLSMVVRVTESQPSIVLLPMTWNPKETGPYRLVGYSQVAPVTIKMKPPR